MKTLLTTIAAVLLVGCGNTAPGISIHEAAIQGNLNRIKDRIAAGEDVNKKYEGNAVYLAKKPNLDRLFNQYSGIQLKT